MKRRNHTIRTTTSTRTRTLQVVAGIGIVAALVAIYTVRKDDLTPTSTGTNVERGIGGAVQTLVADAGEVPFDGPTREVTIYIDGWSLATLGDTTLSARTGALNTTVNFQPLDSDGLNLALKSHPQVVADAVGRLVTADRRVNCNSKGCKTGTGDFDVAGLSDAPSLPVFGTSYKDWGLTAGLYAATLAIPDTSDIVTLAGANYSSIELSFAGVSGLPGEKLPKDRISGIYVAAAYGRLFPVIEYWRDAVTDGSSTSMEPRLLDTVTDEKKAAKLAGALSYGPGDISAFTGSRGLSDSQLTYLSSPSTGCGPVPVCTPVKLPFTRSATTEVTKVCSAEKDSGLLLLTLTKYSVPFSKATHVAGSYGLTPVSEFKGSDKGSSVVGFTGEPLLTVGPTTLYGVEVLLVDDRGIAAIAGARDASPITSAIPTIAELFGGRYTNC